MGDIARNLGIRIKELRERNNLTQQKLAELINMESSNLSKIERGIQMPKEESIESIVKILGIDIHELFEFEHITPKEQLINNIMNIVKNSSYEQMQTYYKVISAIKDLN